MQSVDWLIGGGEMAKVIKAKDWSQTTLGPMDRWPQSLRTTISLAQASNSPISLAWGSGHVQIYNDGYWPLCGAKHPTSMGQDFRECWASAWEVLEEPYLTAWSGKSAYLEKVRMFLDRYGFLEETWFTFSFSPITDESGAVGGVFHPVTELSVQMLSERRTRILRELSNRTSKAKSIDEAFAFAAAALGEAESAFDLPFLLFFAVDEDGATHLVGPRSELADVSWPLDTVVNTKAVQTIDDLRERLGGRTAGPYPEAPLRALALPIARPGSDHLAAVMVAGVSPRLHLNEAYQTFIELVASTVGAALANAAAYEEQRQKAEALAEIDRAKTAFFTNVSHELRTPLTLILGPIEDAIQAARPLTGPDLDTVHRSALRLLRLVNTLLEFSRLEAGRTTAKFEETDLATLTTDLASSFRSLFESVGVELVIDCPPLGSLVHVDRSHWEKIVLNLLSNAFKFTFQGSVTVRQRLTERDVELVVTDTGTGIPAASLPHVFERFHRVEGARGRTFEGSGIGLALVSELVRLRGGDLRAESTEGRGSSFFVTIPLSTKLVSSEQVVSSRAPESHAKLASPYVVEATEWVGRASHTTVGAAERARVLVADDNADMREYIVRLLEPHWNVEAVADGAAALERVRSHPPDLVLSDVMMPRLDGFGLVKAIRDDAATRDLPVVLLSARAGEEAIIGGLESGADDYLIKPFAARELLGRVRTNLEMAQSRARATKAALELAETRATLLRDLERKHEELEAFSYSVSHDLRAPLRSVDGFSQILLEDYSDRLDSEGKSYLERIRIAATRMGQIIDDLLELSRVERQPLNLAMIDLARIAHRVREALGRSGPKRQVNFSVEEPLELRMDPRLAEVLLENLLGNAWKFTTKTEAPRVEVGSLKGQSEPTYYVKDNGAGFDEKYAARLFTPFQRLHGEDEFPGTGIGLATVRRVVERHGGRVWATGAVGVGATIYWTIPAGAEG